MGARSTATTTLRPIGRQGSLADGAAAPSAAPAAPGRFRRENDASARAGDHAGRAGVQRADACPLVALGALRSAQRRLHVLARSAGHRRRDPRSGPASRSADAVWTTATLAMRMRLLSWQWLAGSRVPGFREECSWCSLIDLEVNVACDRRLQPLVPPATGIAGARESNQMERHTVPSDWIPLYCAGRRRIEELASLACPSLGRSITSSAC